MPQWSAERRDIAASQAGAMISKSAEPIISIGEPALLIDLPARRRVFSRCQIRLQRWRRVRV